MPFRKSTVIVTSGAVVLAGLLYLSYAPRKDGTFWRAQYPVTQALQNQERWLNQESVNEPPLPVHEDFSGLDPESMANSLHANGVVNGATGLLGKPDRRFGISVSAFQRVNRAVRIALSEMAAAEKASVLESSGPVILRQWMFSANASIAEATLKTVEKVIRSVLPEDVAGGLSAILRKSPAFLPHREPYRMTFSATEDGCYLSIGTGFARAIEGGVRFEGFTDWAGTGNSGRSSIPVSMSMDVDFEWSESSGAGLRWGHIIPPKETWPARRDLFSTGSLVQKVQRDELPAAFSMVGEAIPPR